MDKDDRFKHISTDPKFRRIPKNERKVKIDKRFKSMFEDERFKVKYTVDKRGKPINQTSNDDLKRYYDLSSEDESNNSKEESGNSENASKEESNNELNESGKFVVDPKYDLTEKIKSDKKIPDVIKKKLKNLNVDYARGEGQLISDSSSDDASDVDESSDDEMEHGWGELDKDADSTEEATNRLAICNMDWDRLKAVDLMVLFNSFLPPGGLIHSVSIYPSEFGLQRMKEEEVTGPMELVEDNVKEKYRSDDTEEGSKYHMEKLRQYQLNRLKYFYAVMVLDSPVTANKIYTDCDGLEYESSATKIDLRFIPDDTTFDNKPKEVCDVIPELSRYQPKFFTTTALQQAKVELTWDETNPDRVEITKKLSDGKIDDVCESDLRAYLASSSGEESEGKESDEEGENDENPIDKYRALLHGLEKAKEEDENKDIEMEVSWGIDMKEKSAKLVKKRMAELEDKTPFQQFLDKRKDKKKAKREERKMKRKSSESDSENDVPSDVDMNDPYFAEEFDKPEFKNVKKQKAKVRKDVEETSESKQQRAELELLLLNEDDDGKKHFSMKKIQKEEDNKQSKRKRRQNRKTEKQDDGAKEAADEFQVDVKDARFSAIFNSHHFNIDPTDSHYRKTKAMDALIEEKQKRRIAEDANGTVHKKPKPQSRDAELSVLVKSVKRKTERIRK